MSTVCKRQICNNLDDLKKATNKDGNNFEGGYRGKRSGKKVQAAKQAKNSISCTRVEQVHTTKYVKRNFSTNKKMGILFRTLAKECTTYQQSEEGTHKVQSVDSNGTEDNSKNFNSMSKSHHCHVNSTYSTMKEPQNPMNLSKRATLQADGRPYRGTRAGKHVKIQHSFKKVAMLLSALSEECSQN